jgi:putative sulfotransferase
MMGAMEPPVFIVGTGRCGSTMMSNVIRLHPRLLSLSEFFTPLAGRAFTLNKPNGQRFWRLLSTMSPTAGKMLAHGGPIEELLYGFGNGARFRPDNLPPILCTTLPHLTDDHEALYDELAPVVRGRERAPLGDHCRFLFAWLCGRFGRARPVERSGSSLLFVPSLARLFPDATFIHLYRDGRDAAISMRRHPFFRLSLRFARSFAAMGLDPYRPPFIFGTSRLYPLFENVMGPVMPVKRWLAEPPDVAAFGTHWSRTIVSGIELLSDLPPDRVLSLRYEDILAHPHDELARLAAFLGPQYVDDRWLDEARRLPQRPASDWRRLPVDQQEKLDAACRPGLAALGYG